MSMQHRFSFFVAPSSIQSRSFRKVPTRASSSDADIRFLGINLVSPSIIGSSGLRLSSTSFSSENFLCNLERPCERWLSPRQKLVALSKFDCLIQRRKFCFQCIKSTTSMVRETYFSPWDRRPAFHAILAAIRSVILQPSLSSIGPERSCFPSSETEMLKQQTYKSVKECRYVYPALQKHIVLTTMPVRHKSSL